MVGARRLFGCVSSFDMAPFSSRLSLLEDLEKAGFNGDGMVGANGKGEEEGSAGGRMLKSKLASGTERWLPPLVCAISGFSAALTCSLAPSVLAWSGLAASLSILELDHDPLDCPTCRLAGVSEYSDDV